LGLSELVRHLPGRGIRIRHVPVDLVIQQKLCPESVRPTRAMRRSIRAPQTVANRRELALFDFLYVTGLRRCGRKHPNPSAYLWTPNASGLGLTTGLHIRIGNRTCRVLKGAPIGTKGVTNLPSLSSEN
jgi:hypothetical protein